MTCCGQNITGNTVQKHPFISVFPAFRGFYVSCPTPPHKNDDENISDVETETFYHFK